MISKHRNRGIWQLALAFVLSGVFVVLAHNALPHLRRDQVIQGGMVLGLFVYLGTVTLWMVGSFSFANAKGYDTDTMGALFLFLFFLGLCLPVAPILFPIVVLFGLKDKTRHRNRWH
jgi:hypothetical protein